jgi:hypothetical protein
LLSVVAQALLLLSPMQVRICFLFPAMPTRVVSGRSKQMMGGLHTGILRLRVSMDVILFYSEEDVLNVRETTSANCALSYEASFDLHPFVHLKHKPKLQ